MIPLDLFVHDVYTSEHNTLLLPLTTTTTGRAREAPQ